VTVGESAGAVRWFAVWTRSRHEQVVRAQLDEKHVPAFLPTLTKWSRWKDRRKQIEVPLFPGYVFAKFDPDTRLTVLKCTGVVSIVSVNGMPVPVPTDEIENIRTLVSSTLPYDPCPTIRKGTQARLILAVNLIGQGVSVQVDAADVRPL
jgi:transcription antitermination factor NusG